MGAGCSSPAVASPTETIEGKAAASVTAAPAGPRPGHVYLSYHPEDTGEYPVGQPLAPGQGQRPVGDGAAGRVADWLVSRGYVVIMGDPDFDAAGAGLPAVGVQTGPVLTWQQCMQQAVEGCQAFVALVSERYGTGTEARRELHAADTAAAGGTLLLPLWHSGPWPPEQPSVAPMLAALRRVPRGPRPLCRTLLDGVMGELVERLSAEGCEPAPQQPEGAAAAAAAAAAAGPAAAANAGADVPVASSLDWCFLPGPDEPAEEAYVVVSCYTGKLMELVDRLALTGRPTIFDLGGATFSGDLPPGPGSHVPFVPAPPRTAASSFRARDPHASRRQSRPLTAAPGGELLLARPHITLRNGALKLRADQTVRILGAGVVLETVSIITESHRPRAVDLAGGVAGGAAYESGRSMVAVVGAVGVRMMRCQITNQGPHIALWLTAGATAAMKDCQVESASGAGVCVRDAGSVLVGSGCLLQRCSGPCLLLEAGGGVQLEGCSLLDSNRQNGATVGSGSKLRADRCMVSGSQVGVLLYGGSTAELVGCEITANTLAGVEVRDTASSMQAVGTKFTKNGQAGLMLTNGGGATLTNCTVSGNTSHGVLVRGAGSAGALRQVKLSYNGQAGALLSEGARADFAACEAMGNKVCGLIVWGAGTIAAADDCRITQNVQAGLAVKDGGHAQLQRCFVKDNKLPCEVAGPGSRLSTRGCTLDPKPITARGGVMEELRG